MDGARKPWEERAVPGARLASFWLAYGVSEPEVRERLTRDHRLDEDAAANAVEQARRWLGLG